MIKYWYLVYHIIYNNANNNKCKSSANYKRNNFNINNYINYFNCKL